MMVLDSDEPWCQICVCVVRWALIGLIDHVVERCHWTLVLPPVNVSLSIAPRARRSRLSSIFHSASLFPLSCHTARPEIMMICGFNAAPLGLPYIFGLPPVTWGFHRFFLIFIPVFVVSVSFSRQLSQIRIMMLSSI